MKGTPVRITIDVTCDGPVHSATASSGATHEQGCARSQRAAITKALDRCLNSLQFKKAAPAIPIPADTSEQV